MAYSVSIYVPSPVLKDLGSLTLGEMFVQETDLEFGAPVAYVVTDVKTPSNDVPCMLMSQGQDVWMPLSLPASVKVAKLLDVSLTANVESA